MRWSQYTLGALLMLVTCVACWFGGFVCGRKWPLPPRLFAVKTLDRRAGLHTVPAADHWDRYKLYGADDGIERGSIYFGIKGEVLGRTFFDGPDPPP